MKSLFLSREISLDLS